jgi:hypothetical protein
MNPSLFRTNLKTLLAARSDYTTLSAKVHAYPPGKLATTHPTVFINAISDVTNTGLTLDGDFERTYQITLGGYAPAVGQASTDADWATMETNAYTLIDGVRATIQADPSVGTACDYAWLTQWNLVPSQLEDNSRVFMDIEATITARVFP